jgi:hypothetical protein
MTRVYYRDATAAVVVFDVCCLPCIALPPCVPGLPYPSHLPYLPSVPYLLSSALSNVTSCNPKPQTLSPKP